MNVETKKDGNMQIKLLDLQAITMQHAEEYEAAARRVIES
jgi:hypothetical protein